MCFALKITYTCIYLYLISKKKRKKNLREQNGTINNYSKKRTNCNICNNYNNNNNTRCDQKQQIQQNNDQSGYLIFIFLSKWNILKAFLEFA